MLSEKIKPITENPEAIKPPQERILFYGRRHGRRLRPNQAAFLDNGMAKYSISKEKLENSSDSAEKISLTLPFERLYLEIGFGGGEHLVGRAEADRNAGFIGAEPFINGVASLCWQIAQREISNIRIWAEDVRLLLPHIKPATIAGVFILFPDPWPKKRHYQRRILQPSLLDEISRVMIGEGSLLLASDHAVAKTWMLEAMMRRKDFQWQATTPEDWREPPSDWIKTRYMVKAEKAERVPSWFCFKKLADPKEKGLPL